MSSTSSPRRRDLNKLTERWCASAAYSSTIFRRQAAIAFAPPRNEGLRPGDLRRGAGRRRADHLRRRLYWQLGAYFRLAGTSMQKGLPLLTATNAFPWTWT